MESLTLSAVCPTCGIAFCLKGSKLRGWRNKKSKNPLRKGPFCGYKCSGKYNAGQASTRRLSKHSEEVTRILDRLSQALLAR